MKSVKNEKLIKRNGTIGNYASLAGIALIAIPLYFYMQAVLQGDLEKMNFTMLLLLTFGGLFVSQLGMYLGTKFGRSPRPDEKLDAGLKGLQNEFVLYHYMTPVSHFLVGPAGAWVLKPYHQGGQVTFKKNRWRNTGGGFTQSYLRIFGQEGLGRPDLEMESEIQSLKKYLRKRMDESEIPEINGLLVFTNDNVELEVGEAPVPVLKLKQLKEFMRQKAKENKPSTAALDPLKAVLDKEG